MKKYIKIVIDIIMLLLFLYLMSYHAGQGLLLHALLGLAMFTLFIIHHLLNLQWYQTLRKGKYGLRRIALSVTDILLLLAMLLMMLSSFMISGLVFDLDFLPVRFYWRDIHVASTAWGFMLTALHLGFHLHGSLSRLEKKLKQSIFEYVAYLLEGLITALGVYGFVRSGLAHDMAVTPQSIPALPMFWFYAEYIGIIAAVCILAHWALRLTDHRIKGKG